MLAYIPVEFNFLETPAKTVIIPARQNQFIQENFFNNAKVRPIAIAMKTNSSFSGFFTENSFWYQHFDLRQIRLLRGGQQLTSLVLLEKTFKMDNVSVQQIINRTHYSSISTVALFSLTMFQLLTTTLLPL